MASTSMGAAPTIASPSLKAMTGYCGWPVAVILAQSPAAETVLANARATNTLKQRNLFMVKILVLSIGVGRCIGAGWIQPLEGSSSTAPASP